MYRPLPLSTERASLCLSAGAFVLSACALLVSLHPAGLVGSGSGAALAAEAPPVNYVSLGQLVIQAGQLADGVVGSPQLLEGAVTSPKLASGAVTANALAAGAVTLAKMDADALAAITAASRVSASLVGEVDELGDVIRGTGFTVERLGPGEYALTFGTAFAIPPVVVAVAQQYAMCYQPRQELGPDRVRIKCMSDLLGSAPSPMDTRFSFYAAPPA